MMFSIIITVILYITLIFLIYNVIVELEIKPVLDKLNL